MNNKQLAISFMLFHPQTSSYLLSQLFVTHLGVALLYIYLFMYLFLDLQMDSSTSDEKLFPCPQCDKVFNKQDGLVEHERAKHKSKKECKHCGKQFEWRQSLNRHKKICTQSQLKVCKTLQIDTTFLSFYLSSYFFEEEGMQFDIILAEN